MANKSEKSLSTIAAPMFALLFAALSLMLLVPQTRSIALATLHGAKLSAIDWGLLRYNHPVEEWYDRVNSLDVVAGSGRIHRLDFAFDCQLNSDECLRIDRLDIPRIFMMTETGERTDVLVFVNDAQTLKNWEVQLEAIQAEFDDAK